MSERIENMRSRAQQYRFLASVYLAPPTDQLLVDLKKLGLAAGDDPEAIRREYDNLFVVPLGQYTTPYEAVYRDAREVAGEKVRGLLMGPSTVDAIQRYREAGAEMDKTIKELPDHIGVELAFMQFLCEREAEAVEAGDASLADNYRDRRTGFLRDHLVPWVPLLAEKIRRNGRLRFYKELASLTLEILFEGRDCPDHLRFKRCGASLTEEVVNENLEGG